MKKVEIIEYTQEDYELLKKPLPNDPCSTCRAGYECCGCPEEREYASKVKPYKDAGIYEVAVLLNRRKININKMEELTKEIAKIDNDLFGEKFSLDKNKLKL